MSEANTSSRLFEEFAGILMDPASQESICVRGGEFAALPSGRRIEVIDGIPNLFASYTLPLGSGSPDVTDIVKAFYEKTPFPNYDGFDSRDSLTVKARRTRFADLLDRQLPDGALVFEAGCGTGQLSNFLGMSWKRNVFAGDICLNSLRLAKEFADRHMIRNVAFLQMNLFQPPFRDGAFDVVISNGVLHHTGNAEAAFQSILAKLKPGGHIIIGLYNSFARLPTLWRRWVFRTFGPCMHFLDRQLKEGEKRTSRVEAWFMDQYRHPHETRHSMDEVLGWFERNGVEFVNSIPHVDGSNLTEHERLFEHHPVGQRVARIATQMGMLLSGGKDGGLFILIGKKR